MQSIRLNQRAVWDLDPGTVFNIIKKNPSGIPYLVVVFSPTFPAASHMFGVKDGDWPSIVLAMFAVPRKLDKLILDNHPYSDFLSAESENALRKVSQKFAFFLLKNIVKKEL